MSYKRILLPIDATHDDMHVADAAFAVANTFGAEVEGLLAQPDDGATEWLDNYGLTAEEVESLNAKARKQAHDEAKKAQQAFAKHASRHPGVTAEFHASSGRVADVTTRHAYASDLTVIGTQKNFNEQFWYTASDCALFRSGRPVLVAPSRPVPANLGSRILIAWKECKEAARAINAALPFLAHAAEVSLVTVTDDKTYKTSLEKMERYLSLHRSDVTMKLVEPGNDNIGKKLIDAAAEQPGTILVMGAYGHHRWEERIFGGATEYVLNNTDVPVLLAH